MLLKNPRNPILGPLNKWKMDTGNPLLLISFSYRILSCFEESLLTQVPTITILDKNIKEMGFLLLEALFIRDP